MGAALADELAPSDVEHIHAHHGYFASWMALVAARLLGIGFSFTLHGSDLLRARRSARRQAAGLPLLRDRLRLQSRLHSPNSFRRRRLQNHRAASRRRSQLRLGHDVSRAELGATADSVFSPSGGCTREGLSGSSSEACAALRDQGLDFLCWIVGEGPERPALERSDPRELDLQDRVLLCSAMYPAPISPPITGMPIWSS